MKGQSLIELIIAIGIFVFLVSTLAFLVLDSYISGRLALEITKANFLAEEGLEAARSIRDNNWQDLANGDYSLDSSTGNWRFIPGSEIIDGKFARVIRVEEVDPINPDLDRKKVTSQITWQFSEERTEEVKFITYLTNWQKIPIGYCTGICTPCGNFVDRTTCNAQAGCSWSAKLKKCTGICTPCDTFTDQSSCETQLGCHWAWE